MAKTSDRTRKLRRLRNAFCIISYICCLGLTAVMASCAMAHFGSGGKANTEILSEAALKVVMSVATTAIIGIVVTIFIKDKMRHTLYMADVIMASLLWGATGMYTVLAIWFVDEYVFRNIYLHAKDRHIINKEIDLR